MIPISRKFLAQALLLALFPGAPGLASATPGVQSSVASTDTANHAGAKPAKDADSKPLSGPDGEAAPAANLGDVDDILRVQVLLERAHFSPGVIDGRMGGNTRRAISAYQSAHGLEKTGEPDSKTIQALGGADAPVLTRYALSEADVAGPFRATPDGPEAMSKVDALPFASVEEQVAEQFHVTPGWLRERNPGVELVAGATLVVPVLDGASALPKPSRVVVDESDKSLLLEDAQGKVVAHFPVTTGSASFPLPVGEWKVTGVATDPVWHFDPKLISGTAADAKPADIPPGPNNPVGIVWIDLSKEHYGIHGTPDPERIGKTASNGCIRMTNWSALALAKAVAAGTPVTMRR